MNIVRDGHVIMGNGDILLTISPESTFACCGARCFRNLDGQFSADLENDKATFLAALLSYGKTYTWYFLPATYQLEKAKTNKYSILRFMLDMGAEEIDSRPNKNHGPNNMHMHAWYIMDHRDKWKHLVKWNASAWRWEAIPQVPSTNVVAPAAAVAVKKVPLRDARGRFVKKEPIPTGFVQQPIGVNNGNA